jgi:hypothetical protein
MFRRPKLSHDRITVLDIHSTSPGREVPAPEAARPEGSNTEPTSELYIRANQFYLRSRLSRLRRTSSTIV